MITRGINVGKMCNVRKVWCTEHVVSILRCVPLCLSELWWSSTPWSKSSRLPIIHTNYMCLKPATTRKVCIHKRETMWRICLKRKLSQNYFTSTILTCTYMFSSFSVLLSVYQCLMNSLGMSVAFRPMFTHVLYMCLQVFASCVRIATTPCWLSLVHTRAMCRLLTWPTQRSRL